MAWALGIDGCRFGWLGITLDRTSGRIELCLAKSWRSLPWRGAAMVAVDMPLGLAERGPRACDVAARRLLPPGRKSSVFPPPRRYMLTCPDWASAQALGRAHEGCGLSKQAWNIAGRIRELDDSLKPGDQERIREVHPELVFHRLNAWRPLPPKRSGAGQRQRLTLLHRAGLARIEPWLDHFPRKQAARDDVIDAAACVLAAQWMLRGDGKRLPAGVPPRDARGLRMEIWY